MSDLDYGIERAKHRAEENRKRQESEALKTLKQAKSNKGKSNQRKKKPMPKVEWSPEIVAEIGKYDIDWEDEITVSASDGLVNRILNNDDVSSQVLKMPPGTGKTAVIVRTLGELQRKRSVPLKIALILPPNVYEQGSWQGTISNYNYNHPDNTLSLVLLTTFNRFSNLLDNPEGLLEFTVKRGMNDENSIIVMDEVHNYKDPVSKRSKMLQKVSDKVYRLGLSGTPILNDEIMDGSSYLVMSGLYRNKSNFIKEHGLQYSFDDYYRLRIYDRNTRKVRPELYPNYPRFLQELSQIIFMPKIVRDTKPEDMGMPTQHEKTIQLDFDKSMSDDLTSLSKAFKKKMFDSRVDLYMEIVRRIHIDDTRLDELMTIINDKSHKQVLVFYQHKVVRDAIVERFKQEHIPVRIIDGEHDRKDIDIDDLSPILVQYQAGSEAIEFKKSNTSVIFQHQPSASTLEQARKRNVRRNMEHDDDITLYYIVADNPFDQDYYSTPLLREQVNRNTSKVLNKISDIKLKKMNSDEQYMVARTLELLDEYY